MAVTDYTLSGELSWPDSSPAQYVGLQGRLLTADTNTFASPEANVRQKMSHAGTCSMLRVRAVASSSSGATVVTLLNNGSATSLTVTISAGGTVPRTEEDSTHSVSFSAGDELSWKIELPSGGGSSPTTVSWISVQIAPSDPANPDVLDYGAGGVRNWTVRFGNLNQYVPPQGELLSGVELSDAETN